MNESTQSHPPSAPPPAAPPSAPAYRRPVQAEAVSYTAAWLHFLIVVALVVAWYFPLKMLANNLLWPRAGRNAIRDSYAFVALAYEGVSSKTNEVSPARFREQLDALRQAGYTPITLEDVDGLLRRGQPLPRRAALITFDHARKTSYFATHSILRRAGWNAVMFLWVRPILERDQSALLWPYLRNMARSRLWEMGGQSYNGFDRVQTSPRGRTGNFMTSPRWLAPQRRFESLAEFERRIESDHTNCISQIRAHLRRQPIAYAYPYGDFGQYQSRAVMTRPINLAMVEKYYKLGFLSGNLAANTRYSDPRRLNRLQVRPEWTGPDLVARLESAWPRENVPFRTGGRMNASSWIVDWGEMAPQKDGTLTLYAPAEATGAKMWLAGSDLNRDYYVRVKFRLDQGQLGLYMRAAADSESYVYLGIDPQGDVWLRQMAKGRDASTLPEDVTGDTGVWLRQKQVSAERFTLASAQIELKAGEEHTLEVHIRDRLLFAHIGGREIFRTRNMLRGELNPGLFGLSVWSPQKGRARVHITDVELHRQDPAVVFWNEDRPNAEPNAFRRIYEHAYRMTHLGPEWMTATLAGTQVRAALDLGMCRLVARVNHMLFTPQVVVKDDGAIQRLSPALVADKLKAMNADGVYVNFSGLSQDGTSAMAAWIRHASAVLQQKKLSLLIALPAALEQKAMIQSLLAVAPNAAIVVSDDSKVKTDPALRNAPIITAEAVPDSDDDLPLFYMIPGVSEGTKVETQESRISRLQQEGLAAYLDGQYARAVEYWKEWHQLEPDNPRALMLIGDATVRLGDLRGALQFYSKSLEIDPGQISLAIRRARLLDDLGDADESVKSLNLYARLFPENIDVLLAQTEWLAANDRQDEALRLARRILHSNPEMVSAMNVVIRLADSGSEEYASTMRKLIEIGARPENQLELGQAIWRYDLGAYPGSTPLMQLASRMAETSKDPRIAELYRRIAPKNELTEETFSDGRPSNRWWVEGGTAEGRDGMVTLAAGPSYTEANMRLLGSLHMRNCFVEAVAGETAGSLWLYTSRASRHIARFGFSDDGFLHLQIREGSRMIGERKMPWRHPGGKVRLRMESGADGVMGFVNGVPVFTARLPIPESLGLGWIGCSVFSDKKGQARSSLYGLSAGPVAPRIAALTPAATTAEADAQMAELRGEALWLHALSPAWYSISETGVWMSAPAVDKQVFRVFSKYHRIWLMPMVDVRSSGPLNMEEMAARAVSENADGFVLVYRTAPARSDLDVLRAEADRRRLRLLVLTLLPDRQGEMTGLGRGVEFTGGVSETVRIRMLTKEDVRQKSGGIGNVAGVVVGY